MCGIQLVIKLYTSTTFIGATLYRGHSKTCETIFVVCWHRPPDSTVDKFQDLENVISYLETFQKEIIFPGDTNCNLLEGNSCGSGPAKHMRSFLRLFWF